MQSRRATATKAETLRPVRDEESQPQAGATLEFEPKLAGQDVRLPVFVEISPKVPELMSRFGFPGVGWLKILFASMQTSGSGLPRAGFSF